MPRRDIELRALCLSLALATLSVMPAGRGGEARTVSRLGHDGANTESRLRVHLSWGYKSAPGTPFRFKLLMAEGTLEDLTSRGLEDGDTVRAGTIRTRAGGGEVDGVVFTL